MNTSRIVGIDYLRAFFSVCVVLGHLGYVSPSLIFSPARYVDHTLTWSDVFNFYGIILSVPAFFLIANFLTANRPSDPDYLKAYLKRIGKLTVFWAVLIKVFLAPGWAIAGLPPCSFCPRWSSPRCPLYPCRPDGFGCPYSGIHSIFSPTPLRRS